MSARNKNKNMRILLILIAMAFIFYGAAFSDTIHLYDGTEINGEVMGIENDYVRIRTEEASFLIRKSRIKKIETDKAEDREIEDERPISPPGPQWDRNWEK